MLKQTYKKTLKKVVFLALIVIGTSSALPKATDLVSKMGFGYNIGNTMEVPTDPTLWGNTVPTKVLIDSLKAAGFNTVRIPTAWYTHSDTTSNTINESWLAQIKTLVDYCIANEMYVIVNSHWDNGWLEDEVFSGTHPDRNGVTVNTDSSKIRARQYAYWTQIANTFKNYDEHLLFAGANEPGVNDHRGGMVADGYTDNGQYGFNSDRMKILKSYYQAFIDAVRSTGGNNATRTLIIQSPRTEIDKVDLLLDDMPTDPAGTGYLMAEVHFYPYQFSLMTEDADWGKCYYYWGDYLSSTDATHNTPSTGFASPAWVDETLASVSQKFAEKNMPVVIGEYGAIKRLSLSGDNLELHLKSRAAFYGAVAKNSKNHGMIPVLWDTGSEGNENMTVIQRQNGVTGSIFDYDVLNAMRSAYGLSEYVNGNPFDYSSNKSVKIEYDYQVADSSWGQVSFGSISKDISAYTSIVVRAYVAGTTNTSTDYGYLSPNLVVMTGNDYVWREASIGELSFDSWKEYTIPISSNIADTANGALVPASNDVRFFGFQTYSKYYVGQIYIDYIVFKSSTASDTLFTFNQITPDKTTSAVLSISLVATESVPTTTVIPSLAKATVNNQFSVSRQQGYLLASFVSQGTSPAKLTLMNTLGQVLDQKIVQSKIGLNTVNLQNDYQGVMIVRYEQGSVRQVKTIKSF